jgi:hypothetical protein
MIKKASLAILFCIAIAATAPAQEAAQPKSEATAQAQAPPRSYRLDYTLIESENGKKIDSRQYSITVGGGTERTGPSSGQVKIGTRIPVDPKGDAANQYLDVGTKLSCVIRLRDGAPSLDTNIELSSVVPDEGKGSGLPIFRTLTISDQTPLVVGKSVMVGTAEDPDSKRQFQLEVTVTEIK